jgi:hypothetical protein
MMIKIPALPAEDKLAVGKYILEDKRVGRHESGTEKTRQPLGT